MPRQSHRRRGSSLTLPPGRRLLAAAAISLGVALGGASAHGQTATLEVRSTVVRQCVLTGGTLDFGTYVQGQNVPKNGHTQITVDCPANIDVTINMNQGGNPDPGGSRNMAFGGDLLNYQLYRDPTRTEVWGTGTGASGGKRVDPTVAGGQPHEVYGQIAGGQAPSTTGDYTDTVIVSLAINS